MDGGRDTWRVMTWNVLGARCPDLTAVARVIADQSPDVVALQEIRRSQARELARSLGWRVRWTRKHYPWSPLAWWLAEGLAVLSPDALSDARRLVLTPWVSSWTYRHRVLLAATVTRRGGEQLRCYDVHLSSDDPDRRINQSTLAAALIAAERPPLAVVAGDLNDANPIEVVRELHGVGLGDPGGSPTSPAEAPARRLDYVLIPRHAVVVDDWTPMGGAEWRALSDHLPTVVAFTAERIRSAPSSGAAPSPSPSG